MPLYEYKCQQCHRHTEKRQKFSDPEITECPHCGGHLQRVLSAPAIAFKGGGWYADGYGNAKPKSATDGNTDGKSSGEGKSEAATSPDTAAKPAASGDSAAASAPASPAPSSAPSSSPATVATKS